GVTGVQACALPIYHVFGPAVDALLAVGAFHLAELRHHQRLVAPAALERAPEQRLVVAPAVHVGRIEVVHPALERVVDDADRLLVVGVSVDARHRHQAEADGGDFEGRAAELALFHGILSGVRNRGRTPIISVYAK